MKKTIFVLLVGNYLPRLCSLTIPSIERYAKRIGAQFRLISERRWPDWPVNYEKVQIFDFGVVPRGYGWSFPKKQVFSIGVGTTPASRVVVGGLVRTTTYFTLGTDLDLSAQAVTLSDRGNHEKIARKIFGFKSDHAPSSGREDRSHGHAESAYRRLIARQFS